MLKMTHFKYSLCDNIVIIPIICIGKLRIFVYKNNLSISTEFITDFPNEEMFCFGQNNRQNITI